MFHDKGYVGSLLKGLFGYNGDPSAIELVAWLLTASGLGFMWKKVSTDK
jgi:high-affinity iron transporter